MATRRDTEGQDDRRRGVPGVVQPRRADAGVDEQSSPGSVVGARVDGRPLGWQNTRPWSSHTLAAAMRSWSWRGAVLPQHVGQWWGQCDRAPAGR
jgi:hypothetical protein